MASFILSPREGAQVHRSQFGHAHKPSDSGRRSHLGARDRPESFPPAFIEADEELAGQLAAERWDDVHSARWISVEEVQAAKWASKAGRALGPDGLVVEVWQYAPPEVDWALAAGLTRRLANVLAAERGSAIWKEVLLRLLEKTRVPRIFKELRPIALENASARVWSRLMFSRFQVFGDRRDECSLSFKRGHSVNEVSLVFRLLRDRCLEWGKGVFALQLDFAAACDSVVLSRGVPKGEVM